MYTRSHTRSGSTEHRRRLCHTTTTNTCVRAICAGAVHLRAPTYAEMCMHVYVHVVRCVADSCATDVLTGARVLRISPSMLDASVFRPRPLLPLPADACLASYPSPPCHAWTPFPSLPPQLLAWTVSHYNAPRAPRSYHPRRLSHGTLPPHHSSSSSMAASVSNSLSPSTSVNPAGESMPCLLSRSGLHAYARRWVAWQQEQGSKSRAEPLGTELSDCVRALALRACDAHRSSRPVPRPCLRGSRTRQTRPREPC